MMIKVYKKGEERPDPVLEPDEKAVILVKRYIGDGDDAAYDFLMDSQGTILRFESFADAVAHLRTFTKTSCGCGAPSDYVSRPGERRPRRYKATPEHHPVW